MAIHAIKGVMADRMLCAQDSSVGSFFFFFRIAHRTVKSCLLLIFLLRLFFFFFFYVIFVADKQAAWFTSGSGCTCDIFDSMFRPNMTYYNFVKKLSYLVVVDGGGEGAVVNHNFQLLHFFLSFFFSLVG